MLVCMPLMIAAGCASLPDHPELPPQASMPPGSDAPLDLTLSEAESQHAGEAGFRLVVEGMEAFVIRAQSANMAARSIDVQSYIWHADATGQYLARVLNCEQGVLVEDAVLAAQLGEIFRLQSAANRAWKVTLDTGELRWSDGGEILDSEPRASAWRKFQAWFARAFHLDAQLQPAMHYARPPTGVSMIERFNSTAAMSVLAIVLVSQTASAQGGADEWHSLFNGKDLSGWTAKIAKHRVGENYANTFRVEDGVLKVGYDKYGKFDDQFGHLYSNQPYSNYILRLEYKIGGSAIADSPPWAKLNSGVMVHSQSPLSMRVEQAFPVSMEFQFLSVGATAGRQTGNVCTPGTNLEMKGKVLEDHIIDSSSKLFPLDEWVTAEIEVRGNDEIIHRINGVEVLRYQHPQLDPRDADAQALIAAGAPLQLAFGHIALQAESQPIWFRNIRIKPLPR
jgi:hypothetical protein